MKNFSFNYIVTIHNKESLINRVLTGITHCMSENSHLYAVLDGCTDNSEKLVDQIIDGNPNLRITKILADDVHELRSINMGLKGSVQTGIGFNIILQDDVIINDFDIEKKITYLYSKFENLGIVSFRHGANISRKLIFKKQNFFPLKNYIENELGHSPNPFSILKLGQFTYREIAIKSPICIPFHIVRSVGLPNEIFAPWDDIGYCYEVIRHGFDNGVLSLDFTSKVHWGTTRTKVQKQNPIEVEKRNVLLFKELYLNEFITNKKREIFNNKKYKVFNDRYYKVSKIQLVKGVFKYFITFIKYNYIVIFKK